MERLTVLINVSAELIQQIRVRPLYRGKLPKGLTAKAEKLVEMQEADRVVEVLQQARSLLREAREVLASPAEAAAVGREVAKALDTVSALLRAVSP